MRWFAALLMAIAVPAIAQDVGQFARHPQYVPRSVVSAEMGRCALDRDRKNAVKLVLTYESAEASKLIKDRLMPNLITCLKNNRSATLDVLQVRGAIAEALLTENGAALLSQAAALPPIPPLRVADRSAIASVGCAVKAQPAAAAELLRAPAETPAEAAAFRTIAPSLQACVPATGEVAIKPDMIRPVAAAMLYRAVMASSAREATQ